MKVKELIEYLSKCNPECEVVNDYETTFTTVIENIDHTDSTNTKVYLM